MAPLAKMESASAIDDGIQSKMHGIGLVRTWKGILLVILNEDTNYIIKIIKSLENSSVLINWVNKTVKHEIKKRKVDILVCYEICWLEKV